MKKGRDFTVVSRWDWPWGAGFEMGERERGVGFKAREGFHCFLFDCLFLLKFLNPSL